MQIIEFPFEGISVAGTVVDLEAVSLDPCDGGVFTFGTMSGSAMRIVQAETEAECLEVERAIRAALSGRKGDADVLVQAREMRAKLVGAHASDRRNPWSLKYAAGGLMEIEFLAQTGVLYHGLACRAAGEALPALAANGWIGEDEAAALAEALALMLHLQQIERVALETPIDPKTAGEGLRQAMARACGAKDFAALEVSLAALQGTAAEIGERVFRER